MKRSIYLVIILIVLLAITLPYVIAVLRSGRDHQFIGFLLNPIDSISYLAKMHQGWTGSWRFTLPYTVGAKESAFIFIYYLLLGHLARLSGLPLIWMFHLARLFGAGALLASLTCFIHQVYRDRTDLFILAYWLAMLGAGMGWLVVFFGPLPSDFWVAEAYPFLAMFANPHFPLGLALLIWAFTLLIREATPIRNFALALLGLLIAAVFPFALVVALLVGGAVTIWSWLETRRLEWLSLVSLGMLGGPYLLYQYLAILADPVLAGWNMQNLTPSPPAWDLILSFSPALPLAIWGAVKFLPYKDNPARRLLVSWLVLGPLLVILPFALQRRFMLGYHIPIVLLAGFGLADLSQRWPTWRRRIPALTLGLALPTNLLLILIALAGVTARSPIYYLTGDEANGLDWIQSHTPVSSVVLASPEIGRLIPAFTGRRVPCCHPFETLNASQEENLMIAFFLGQGENVSGAQYLSSRGVDYIFYGPREQGLGGEMDSKGMDIAFESGQVRIYAVNQTP